MSDILHLPDNHDQLNIHKELTCSLPMIHIATRKGHVAFLHFCQDVPCTNSLKSSFVYGWPMMAVFLGQHNLFRSQGGTQNSNSKRGLSIQPSVNFDHSSPQFWEVSLLLNCRTISVFLGLFVEPASLMSQPRVEPSNEH